MLELAEKVIKGTGKKMQLQYEPIPQDDPQQRQPVIDEAKRLLNWEPKVMLEEGLEKTIAYFKERV